MATSRTVPGDLRKVVPAFEWDREALSPSSSRPEDRPATSRPRAIHRTSATCGADRILKRCFDILASLLGLVLLSPVWALLALLILVTSGRPVFYFQERVGEGGSLFRMIKFRSMRRDAERTSGPVWAFNGDARCTRVGVWLRRFNLDELPQLVNVLAGDMSLVGPRPERPTFVAQFVQQYPGYEKRHRVPAGMTGWAQVHGWRGRTSLQRRLDYDLDYVARWTVGMDLLVLFRTVQHVLWGKTCCGATVSPHARPGRATGGKGQRDPPFALRRSSVKDSKRGENGLGE